MIEHLETILDAGLATLRAELPAEIDAINAAALDDIVLPAPGHDLDDPSEAYVLGGWTRLSYPVVEVAAPDWTVTSWSLSNVDAIMRFPAIVRLTYADAALEPGRLYRSVLRYTTAILAVLTVPGAWDTATKRVSLDAERGISGEYGFDPRTNERAETIGETVLTVNLEAAEARL